MRNQILLVSENNYKQLIYLRKLKKNVPYNDFEISVLHLISRLTLLSIPNVFIDELSNEISRQQPGPGFRPLRQPQRDF